MVPFFTEKTVKLSYIYVPYSIMVYRRQKISVKKMAKILVIEKFGPLS